MDLSIIIPALNEAGGIAASVRRAFALRPLDVLVVDGGSLDDTVRSAEHAGASTLVSAPGRGRQLNLGVQHAKGGVLLFLHADTWLDPEGRRQMETALTDPHVPGGAFRQCIEATGWKYRLLERGNALRARRFGMPYGDQGIFLRREVLDRLGGFPETPLMEDWLLMRSLKRHCELGRPVLLDGPLHVSARRWQKQGVVRQTGRNWLLLTAARLGVSPHRLARFYPSHKP